MLKFIQNNREITALLAVVLLADRALPAAGAGAAVLRRRAAPCAALWLAELEQLFPQKDA